ncbi:MULTISPECIES: head-tail joining protein [Rahnella]|uniref:head-tail joining protein n=1 Tax=Rahnella TaxID=34037 RepID=UPI003F6DF59C
MGVNWDLHLLRPLHGVFGDPVDFRPVGGVAYIISGIFDRAYTQDVEPLEDGSTINTTSPVLGVLDSEFSSPPKRGDRVFIGLVGGEQVNTLFAVSDVQPDSHGGSKLILNRVKV